MKTIYRKLPLLLFPLWGLGGLFHPLWGQEGLPFLNAIKQNNTTLKALRRTGEAQQLENKTGIYLPGPDATIDYLWGTPAAIGNRTDITLRQSFDIVALTNIKKRIADQQNELINLQFRADRTTILQEAAMYGIEIIYYNILKKELSRRLQHAETLAATCAKRLETGNATILEYNKAKLYLSSAQGELSRAEVERTALLAELQRLNGGIAIALDDENYGGDALPPDFETWFTNIAAQHPALEYARQDVKYKKQDLTLNKTQNWPSFSIGFISENVVGQRYQGISIGLSIPLWENRNRVKQAAAAVRAAESRQTDADLQLLTRLQTAYLRAHSLRAIAADYRQALTSLNNSELLEKALAAGEISLLEYIVEMELYYSAIQQTLSAERDYRKAVAALLCNNE
ncbi:MAG: TolC family protein [Prevotellaceae bacterium]|jgi:outer membrane protein TolC|nr:TolC family protein [Prevotellaceae bacterium]